MPQRHIYRPTPNISRILVGYKIVDHADVDIYHCQAGLAIGFLNISSE